MEKRCERCGEDSVKEDDGQEVCTSCGTVRDSSCLVSTSDEHSVLVSEDGASNLYACGGLTSQYITRNLNRKPACLKIGKKKIETLCSIISLGKGVKDFANRLYTDLCESKTTFKYFSSGKKEVFSCACLYFACREFELPVTMDYVVSLTGSSVDVTFSAVSQIEEILGIRIKPMTISNLVDAVVGQELQPNIVASEEVKKLTQEILELIADLYLTQGRKPKALIAAAFFLAYQNEDFITRRKLKPNKVIKTRIAVTQRLNLIRPSLLELMKGIPWISQRDHDVSMIPYHLKDIVKFKKTLIKEALDRTSKTYDSDSAGETEFEYSNIGCSNGSPRISGGDEEGRTTLNTADSICGENGTRNCEDEQKSEVTQCRKSRQIKRACEPNPLFYPPAYKMARRRSREREEINKFIEEGLETFERLSKAMNLI